MRKARKKRIVAMTLALSMLASSGGVYGAAAAEPDSTGLDVTVVPLDSADGEPTPPQEASDPAGQPDAPTDGETAEPLKDSAEDPPQGGTSSPDEPDIDRPKQSDTVETLPGTAKDNMEHIKGEDKAETDETEPPEETGIPGDSEKDAETDKPTDEQKPEKKDYSCIYDPDTGHFKITFNITEDAEGDQTVELSKVMEEINANGKQNFDEWLAGDGSEELEEAKSYDDSTIRHAFNGVEYIYNIKDGTVRLYEEPGCTTIFDVSLSNGSKHTYVYKNNSLTVATPDMKNNDKTGVIGFDGQELPNQYAKSTIQLGYNRYGETGCMEHLADIVAEKYYHNTREWTAPDKIIAGMQKYLDENYGGSYEAYILDYFNIQSSTQYNSPEELLHNNPDAVKDLCSTKSIGINQTLTVSSSTTYDNFYQNLFSFNVGSPEEMEEFLKKEGKTHGSWSSDGNQMTIGQYMADKLDETDGAWDKANAYFQTLLASGLTAKEATWAAFTMATNIDGRLTGNDYQDTAWSWYASMVLHQADGTLHLTKTDEKGEVIGDDEGEGQTSFYLWTYDDKTNEPMYCTYVEPTYSTNEDGEQVLEKEGFYCWVKYDPAQDKMNYTITTTGGSLNIDYALLENVVYYLQEALAPEGYDADPNIYVICDQKTYDEMVDSGAFDHVENPAAGTSGPVAGWLGAIVGGGSLSINFVNTKSAPVPDEPDGPDIPPKTPDTPAPPETPDTPPAQEETSEAPLPPQTVESPAAETPRADALPQTGTTFWLSGMLLSFGTALLSGGWFFTRKQRRAK